MGARMTTQMSAVEQFMQKATDIMFSEIKTALAKLGEECVVRVRDRSAKESWIDRTGNLRSSVGYAIYDHGRKFIESAFAIVKDGGEGQSAGKDMIGSLANQYSNVFALVVVAAMNYADFVESLENKDVLASTELWARSVVDGRIKTAIDYATSEINSMEL